MKPNSSQYTIISAALASYTDLLMAELRKFNYDKRGFIWENPPRPVEQLQFYALDLNDSLIGGVIGRTHQIPEWLEITILWVAEGWRHQGIGRHLMELAESEAKQRECSFARLATADYQAPNFYRRLGYQEYGRLENCPRGETSYYFYKELV